MSALIINSVWVALLSGIVWGVLWVLADKYKKYAAVILFGAIAIINPHLSDLIDFSAITGFLNTTLFIIFHVLLCIIFTIIFQFLLKKLINKLAKIRQNI